MNKKLLYIITGTRADYGHLFWPIKKLQESEHFDTKVIATGSHLETKYGLTVEQIKRDGIAVFKEIPLGLASETSVLNTNLALAKAIGEFSRLFDEKRPDLILILGDRYEILAVATASLFYNIPLAHIHGGELTLGAVDDSIRHAISKMAHIHFTACETYRQRVIQMGEAPERVFNVGAPGLESIRHTQFLSSDDLARELNFSWADQNMLITSHPTTKNEGEVKSCRELVLALKKFSDVGQIITCPNADPGSDAIAKMLHDYASERANVILVKSLGPVRYYSALKLVDVVVGNSSSGLIEAPFVHTPTVNIGARQRGREAGNSVLHCQESEQDITSTIDQVLSGQLAKELKEFEQVYGDGDSAQKIVDILQAQDLGKIVNKNFCDILRL